MTDPRRIIFVAICFLIQTTMLGCREGQTTALPPTFKVPKSTKFSSFQLQAIQASDAEADYEAVMESRIRLRKVFGGTWPRDDFSLDENRNDLQEHERAFKDRESFTYSIVSLNSQRILGCVYLLPRSNAKATALFWIRDSALETHPESHIRKELESWLKNDWPIEFEFHAANNSK